MRRGKPESQMGCALSDMHKSAAEAATAESEKGIVDSDHRAVDLRNGMAGA
jgi:hypothetical protein